jgi:SAM-dependent methyltransferase
MTDSFWTIHEDLPRQGPGSDKTTQKLFDIANSRQNLKRAIDMGCGSGRSSLLIAANGLDVVAIDTHEAFLNQLRASAAVKGLTDKIEIANMSMENPMYPEASFDLVWSEGTAYIIGLKKALVAWRRLLKPHGELVLTDCYWLTDRQSPEAIDFWKADDPLMVSVEKASDIMKDSGYSVDFTYVQPDSDWFDEYYNPLTDKIIQLSNSTDPSMQAALQTTKLEINIRRKYADEYGHVGFVLSV